MTLQRYYVDCLATVPGGQADRSNTLLYPKGNMAVYCCGDVDPVVEERARLQDEVERLNMEMVSYRAKLTPADAKAMAAVIKALWEAKHGPVSAPAAHND